MTRDDIATILIDELGRIAPEIDARRLDPNAALREELDINSMDFLNLVTALSERLSDRYPRNRLSEPRQLRPSGRLLGATTGSLRLDDQRTPATAQSRLQRLWPSGAAVSK